MLSEQHANQEHDAEQEQHPTAAPLSLLVLLISSLFLIGFFIWCFTTV